MTIEELCKEVARTHSLDVSDEKAIEYQDLIGHASTQELDDVSNMPELIETFYRIYGVAYGTPAAIKFYVEHSDRQIDMRMQLDDAKETLKKKDSRIKELEDGLMEIKKSFEENKELMQEIEKEARKRDTALRSSDEENVRLKAEIYDLTKEVEAMKKALAERN